MAKRKTYSHVAATFNGSNEYVSRTSNLYNYQHYALGTTTGITVWHWIKTSSTAAQWILGNWNIAGNDNGWGISIKATTGLLVGQLTADEVTPYQIRVESDVAVNDGEWHLVLMSYDGSDGLSQASNTILYVDGIPVPTTTINDTLQRVPATGTLTSTAIPNDGDTVTIGTPSVGNGEGSKTYTFQTTLTDVDGNVAIGGSQAQAMENLRRAINLDGVAGTNYATSMTLHPDVNAQDTATTVVVTCNLPTNLGSVGNEITTTETSSVMSWGGSTLSGANNRSTSTGTILPYHGKKGSLTDYFAGTMADGGMMYRALTQAEVLEIWGDGTPTDPKAYSFAADLSTYGGWFNGGNGGDVWDAGDGLFFASTDPGIWYPAFGGENASGSSPNGTDVSMEKANNYSFDSPFRGFMPLSSQDFDGSDDHVDMGDVHDFERTDTFSFSFWFFTATGAAQVLIAKGNVGSTAGYEVSLDASGSVVLFLTNTASGSDELNVRTTSTDWDNGAWHHCVVTYDGTSAPGGCHIFIDNSDEALTTISNTLSASILNNDALRFGARSDGSNRFTGQMTQAAFFDVELTASQVSTLWNQSSIAFSRRALVFDGVDEYVLLGDVHNFERTDTFSWSFWVKTTSAASGHLIAREDTTNTPRGWGIYMDSSGRVGLELVYTDGTNLLSVYSNKAFNDGLWHHITITYDGSSAASGVTIYESAVALATTTAADTLSNNIAQSATLWFGSREADHPTNAFDGQLDDIAAYDVELTQAQVTTIYNKGLPIDNRLLSTASSLVGYWLLGDGDTSTTIKDRQVATPQLAASSMLDRSVSANPGTPTNMEDVDFTTDTPGGVSGYSMTLDGTNEYVLIGDVSELAFDRLTAFSISAWFKSSSSSAQRIFTKQGGGVSTDGGYALYLDSGPVGALVLELVKTSTTDAINVKTPGGFNDGAWHHVAATYDGSSNASGVTIYVDGISQTLSVTWDTLTSSILTNAPAQISGRDGTALSNLFNGQLDEVAIFDKELSQAEVTALHNDGAPADATLVLKEDLYPNLVGYWLCGDISNDGTMTNMEANDITPIDGAPLNLAEDPLWISCIGWWWLDAGDTASTITDRSSTVVGGGQNDGTTSGSPALSGNRVSRGQYHPQPFNTYCYMDSSRNQHISCGNVSAFQFDISDAFSLECWFRTVDTTGNYLLSKMDDSTRGYYLYVNTDGTIYFDRRNTATTDNARIVSVVPFNDGAWHHIVATTDGSDAAGMSIYVDGVLQTVTVAADTLSATILSTAPFQIADRNDNGGNTLEGDIADVAVYSVELTADQVLEHFNAANVTLLERGSPSDRTQYTSYPNLAAWYPFTACWTAGSTHQVLDMAVQSHNHGTFSGTNPGLGQVFTNDPPQGSGSAFMGDVAPGQTGVADLIKTGGNGPINGMPLPSEQNDGLGYLDSSISGGNNDLDPDLVGGVLPQGGGTGITEYFLMRGIDDNGPNYTTWVVTDAPDPNGDLANAGNTTPALVGNIVAGSGIVVTTWQQ